MPLLCADQESCLGECGQNAPLEKSCQVATVVLNLLVSARAASTKKFGDNKKAKPKPEIGLRLKQRIDCALGSQERPFSERSIRRWAGIRAIS